MNDVTGSLQLAAEQRARVLIDRQLTDAGWSVQDGKRLNLYAGQGIAVREVIMALGHGRAEGLPAAVRLKALTVAGRLPCVFEASGSETL